MIKKIALGVSAALFCVAISCNKEEKGLAANSWSMSGKTFDVDKVTVSTAQQYIAASDGKGSTLTFSFFNLPASNADLNVNSEAYTNSDIAMRAVLSGNIIYSSVPSAGAFVSVRVDAAGKYTLIANNIKFVNANKLSDTVNVSTYIVQN